MSDKNEEKKWLVKNNNQIIGPFTESELKTELDKGYLSPFATACVPGQMFWGFIAAYPEFASHTDTTRLTLFTKSLRTDSQTYTGGTQTNPHENQDDQATDVLFSDAQDLPYKQIEEASEVASMEDKKSKINLFFLLSSIVVLVGCVFLFFYNKKSDKHKSQDQLTASYFGQIYFATGNYLQALKMWEKEENALSQDNELLFKTLRFQLNNNIFQGEEIIKRYENRNPDLKKMIRALIQLKTGDSQSAGQLFIELIDSAQSQDVKKAAFANWALLSAKTGNCEFFKKYMEDEFGNKNLISFSFSLCLLQSQSATADQKMKAESFLQVISQKPQDYYQESLVGLAYIKSQKGEPILSLIVKLLDSDPELTKNYYYDVYVDRKIYSWPQLLPLCKQIYSTDKNNRFLVTFYAYCLVRSYHHELAQQFIKQAVLIDSKDVLIKTIHAYIVSSINFKDQSVLILGDAIQSNSDMQYVLPYILQAQFCEENEDWDCAVQNWQLVLKNTPDSISGLSGLAYAKYSQGHYEEAKAYMEHGFGVKNVGLYGRLLFVEKMLEAVKDAGL